jgi:hypothetical protein
MEKRNIVSLVSRCLDEVVHGGNPQDHTSSLHHRIDTESEQNTRKVYIHNSFGQNKKESRDEQCTMQYLKQGGIVKK